MDFICLPFDLNKLCISFLDKNESMYYCNNWDKFNKNEISVIAANYSWLDLLKWARKNNCPWGKDTCAYAARNGHLNILKWMHDNNCPWNEYTCAWAAQNGHFDILKWARKNNCKCGGTFHIKI